MSLDTAREANTVLALVQVPEGSDMAAALAARANILEMTQAAEEAVLRPTDPGGLSLPLRAALAARIARINGEEALAERHGAAAEGETAVLVDPAENSAVQELAGMVKFMDAVAACPRDVQASDIDALRSAGVQEADIVRLCELNAFLAYQIRVLAGIRALLAGASA